MYQFFLACPQRSFCVLLGHSVLVHESFESCTLLGGAFCVAHRALLDEEFVTGSYQHELICASFAGMPF
jgi:hypothetical protein